MEQEERTVLARNSFIPKREHYVQAYREMMKMSDILMFGFVVLMALILGLGAVIGRSPLFREENLVPLAALAIAFFAVIAQHFILPRIYAKNIEKKIRETYGEPGELVTTVYEDGVCMYNGSNNSEVRFGFHAFSRFSESRDLLLLRTKARQTLILSKADFEPGCDEAQFKTLMQEKCPAAKCSWKKH